MDKDILFVEKDQEVAKTLKLMMERLGHRVTVSSRSIEALKLYQAYPDMFKLIISDYSLPNMNGIELAKSIHELNQDIPIVITTGVIEIRPEEIKKIIGVKDVLIKPFLLDDLKNSIDSVLFENSFRKPQSSN